MVLVDVKRRHADLRLRPCRAGIDSADTRKGKKNTIVGAINLDQIAEALAVFEGSLLVSAKPVCTSLQTFYYRRRLDRRRGPA